MSRNLVAAQATPPASSVDVQEALYASTQYQLELPHPGGPFAMAEDACKFLGALVRRLQPQRVLEFGSGLSSTVIATELKRVPGAQLISVDHHGGCQAQARHLAGKHGVSDVIQFLRCPIRPRWYHGKLLFFYDLTGGIRAQVGMLDLVLVDGPPRYWGREAAAYAVYPYLKAGALLLIDDAKRRGEQRAMSEWRKLYGTALQPATEQPFERGLGVFRKCEGGNVRRMFDSSERRRAFVTTLQRVALNRRRLRDCF